MNIRVSKSARRLLKRAYGRIPAEIAAAQTPADIYQMWSFRWSEPIRRRMEKRMKALSQ